MLTTWPAVFIVGCLTGAIVASLVWAVCTAGTAVRLNQHGRELRKLQRIVNAQRRGEWQ